MSKGQFIEFISPVRSEMMWSIYEIIHIFELQLKIKVKNDHRSNFSNLSIDFFRLLLSNCLNWKNYCDDRSFFTFIYHRSSNMNYFIYTSHHQISKYHYGHDALFELNELLMSLRKYKKKLPCEQFNPWKPLWHEQTLGPLQLPRYKQWFSNSQETATENENYKLYKSQTKMIH